MTQGERVKIVRKKLGLTLKDFGERIGLKNNSISQIENNINALTDKTAKSICREFDVNENWLRTGEGEMFIKKTRLQLITDFIGDSINEPESFKTRFLEGLAQLSEKDWESIEDIMSKLAEKSTRGEP